MTVVWGNTGNMATSKMPKAIGIIAEDKSDVAVISALLEKYTSKNKFFIRHFVGNGCGKLKSKCQAWTKNLISRGCEHVFIFHDLDKENESQLRNKLLKKVSKDKFPTSLIVIPIEELEAWLLSDEEAIKSVFTLKSKPKRYKNCEAIKSPKEVLERFIRNTANKRYLNTVHNEKIAKKISLENLRRCSSYLPFDEYLMTKVFNS